MLKFGGTSVGSVESLKSVKNIVENIPGCAIIVVSALGGLTDKLIATANLAEKGDLQWKEEMEAIRRRHLNIIDNVVSPDLKPTLLQKINLLLDDLQRNFEGVCLLKSLPEKILDVIVSFGERMSSEIVAAMISNGKRYYSPDFIKTEKRYGKNIADLKLTESLIKNTFKDLGKEEKAIVPGFISTDIATGEITNLGRGGSDYTGAIIAATMDAKVLEIWTDVDGFMTADPRIVKEALIINHLSFTESMELCTFGAKVIYPPTIYPVFHKNIPIKILNTFNPSAKGTLITDQTLPQDLEIKGVTALKDISLITLNINSWEENSDFNQRALNILSKQAVRIIPVANPDPFTQLNFAIASSDVRLSIDLLTKEFTPEIVKGVLTPPILKENHTALAVVGKNMKSKTGLAARIGHSLLRQGIKVAAYSTENSDTTFIYIIDGEKTTQALPLIHSLIF